MSEPPLCLPPTPMTHLPAERLPAGSCDCHFHVFTPASALSPARGYTPPLVTLDQWLAYADAVGLARGVLVQPSVYGTDNTAMLDALAATPDRLRAIAVIPPDTAPAEVARLDRAGVRGVRINLFNPAGLTMEAVPALARLIAPFGWHLQFHTGPEGLDALHALAASGAVPVVVDHLGLAPVDGPALPAALSALQRLMDTDRAWVKVSASYRLGSATGFARAARTLAASHPERLVWGSDWPHSDLHDRVPDDADLIDGISACFETQEMRRRVLVEAPEALYWRPSAYT